MVRLQRSFLGSFLGFVAIVSLVVAGCEAVDDSTGPDAASTSDQAEAFGTSGDEAKSPDGLDPDSKDPDGKDPVSAQSTGSSGEGDENTVAVPIYVMDDDCNDYVERSVQVDPDDAMSDAVGKVITNNEYDSFELSGYRVKVNSELGIATVDLRLSPESERQFVSLSSCEQRTLFGGVEQTLLSNPDWKIEAVQFTNRGEDIVL